MLSVLRSVRSVVTSHQRRCSGFVSRIRYVQRLQQDDVLCAAALQDARILLFHRLSPLMNRTRTRTFTPATLSSSELQLILERAGSDPSLLNQSVLLGCSEPNRAQFCLDVGELDRAAVEEACGGTFVDLRSCWFLLREADAPLVAKGQALLRWHQNSRFSGATGLPTVRNRAGTHRVCSGTGTIHYPTMSPVVIVLVSDGSRCLLGRQASFPPGLFSALAGFCDMGETVDETVSREVAEEVGLCLSGGATYSSSQHWPFPHSSFMIGCHASVSPAHSELDVDGSELEEARWFHLEEISSALQVKAPPTRGAPPPEVWLPPRHAIAHRLITEWAESQRGRGKGNC